MRRALVAGIVWGVLCGVANGWPVLSTWAQMAVPWVWVAAYAGHRAGQGRQAALHGGFSLLVANLAYHVVGLVASRLAEIYVYPGARFLLLWSAVALVIGPAAGVIGWWLDAGRRPFVAVALLAAVSMAEPLALWAHIDHFDSHIAHASVATAGLAFPWVWQRRESGAALRPWLTAVALTYPAAVGLEAILIALRQISAPMRLI